MSFGDDSITPSPTGYFKTLLGIFCFHLIVGLVANLQVSVNGTESKKKKKGPDSIYVV